MSMKYRHFQDIIVADVNDIIDFIIFMFEQSSGSIDYSVLENKPSINESTLIGNKTNVELGIELKITTGVTTYSSGVVAPTINVNDFNSILSTNAPTITIIAHDANNKTHNYKVSYKTTSGIDNKSTFQLTGIDNYSVVNYVYYLNTNSSVAVKVIQDIRNIYRHYYTMRVNSSWVNQTISFTLDLPTATPLDVNGLRSWFTASPFWDTTSPANSTTKKLFPVVGVAGVQSSNVNNTSGNPITIYSPYSIVGLCYYVEQQGMIINTTLYAYYNYGAYVQVNENTLNCSGVYNLTNGEWV